VSAPVFDADAEPVVRVLVADDEPALREALSDLFAQEPSLDLIGVAADADEAATLASRELPDVALIDVSMPAGAGRERPARSLAPPPPHA
jgi:DNA-binding NarL/FixJ family response regulator